MIHKTDAAAWGQLSYAERRVLTVLGRYKGNVITPLMLATCTGMPWQRAASCVRRLRVFGLATVKSYGKQTEYEISDQGERCLTLGTD